MSFMMDARGGAMRGSCYSGVRIIVPPGKACQPTCKLVKLEKLTHPPPLMEGEALASRVLKMDPSGAKFSVPVIMEVPHFASLRGKEREVVILRSDDGESWCEHTLEATEDAIAEALNGSIQDLETVEELYQKRITRILTTDFPQYFAIVTRIRQDNNMIGRNGGLLSSTVVPQVQAVFPEGSLTKKIKIGIQVQPIQPEVVSKLLGNRVAVSPIVTLEPQRRKFHKPITLTIPLTKASQKDMLNQCEKDGDSTPTLRFLISITGTTAPTQWEDLTGMTELTFFNDCVSFTTSVSARFWLMDCQNVPNCAKDAAELYREAIAVPFMSKFVVFAKRHDPLEARLLVLCMTDDKMDKTLETQEHSEEVARSRDVEVQEGKPQHIEMGGNLVPVTKSEQLYVNFHAFRENQLQFVVRIRDSKQEPVGRVTFMREPKVAQSEAPQQPICNLTITLPDCLIGDFGETLIESIDTDDLEKQYDMMWSGAPAVDESISKAELRLTDIGEALHGDWTSLARQLDITEDEIMKIQCEDPYVSEQAVIMMHLWAQKNRNNAAGNELERALRKIGREDVIKRFMCNAEAVTDTSEQQAAWGELNQPGIMGSKGARSRNK